MRINFNTNTSTWPSNTSVDWKKWKKFYGVSNFPPETNQTFSCRHKSPPHEKVDRLNATSFTSIKLSSFHLSIRDRRWQNMDEDISTNGRMSSWIMFPSSHDEKWRIDHVFPLYHISLSVARFISSISIIVSDLLPLWPSMTPKPLMTWSRILHKHHRKFYISTYKLLRRKYISNVIVWVW